MKFVVDLDIVEPYTDSQGIHWWSEMYFEKPDTLKTYLPLVGQNLNGVTITEVFQDGNVIQAIVKCKEDLTGLYICPKLSGYVEDRVITAIHYRQTTLDTVPVSKDYSIKGLLPCRKV